MQGVLAAAKAALLLRFPCGTEAGMLVTAVLAAARVRSVTEKVIHCSLRFPLCPDRSRSSRRHGFCSADIYSWPWGNVARINVTVEPLCIQENTGVHTLDVVPMPAPTKPTLFT